MFEATMAKEPNRYNGYVGAAMAAQAGGDAARAKANYGKLIELAAEFQSRAADPGGGAVFCREQLGSGRRLAGMR